MRLMAWNFEEFHRRGFLELATVVDMSLFDRVPSSEEIKVQQKLDDLAKDYYPLIQTKVLILFMPMLLRALFAITSALMSAAQKDIVETGVKPKHLIKWIAAENIPVEYLGTAVVRTLEDGSYDVLNALPVAVGQKSEVVNKKEEATTTTVEP
ncbi:transmembrane protein, putative, partial [Bodo saltans]